MIARQRTIWLGRGALWGVLSLTLLICAGCQTTSRAASGETKPREIDPTRIKHRDDITAIYRFYNSDPWLRNSDGEIIGFRVTVYFHSAETQRGVFVPGKILVWLYEVSRQPDGSAARTFRHGWEFDEREAMGYRRRFKSIMGYHYGLMLQWPRELDFAGRQIEIVLGYERLDGRIIEEPGNIERVPLAPAMRRAEARGTAPVRRPSETTTERPKPVRPRRRPSEGERER